MHKRTSTRTITRRLNAVPLSGRPMLCPDIARAAKLQERTVSKIFERGMRKLHGALRRAEPKAYQAHVLALRHLA
jgi:hypothetical protein